MNKLHFSKKPVAHAIALSTLVSGIALPSLSFAESYQLEEVTVTAQRREQSLQEVPVAVTAFDSTELSNAGTSTITELQKSSPNTTLEVSRGTNTTLTAFIRGVGQQDPLWGFEPGVGIYVDDVYIARPQGAVLDVLDIERIEVLRGPQGTLYGKNTIGGAVKYVTRKMNGEANGFVKGTIGSYDQTDLSVGAQIPIIEDVLYIGGSLAQLKRDGFGELKALDKENYNKDITTGRLSIEYTPTETLFMRLALDQTNDTSNARGPSNLLTASNAINADFPQFDLQAPLSSPYDSWSGAGNARQDVDSEGIALTVSWDVSDNLTVKSITAYREGGTNTPIDFDSLPDPSFDVIAFYEDRQFSQEIQFNLSGDRFNLVSGIYYFTGNAEGGFDGLLNDIVPAYGFTLITNGNVQTDSRSVFADLTYDLSDKMQLVVGGRYTSDEKDAYVFSGSSLGLGGCLVSNINCDGTFAINVNSDFSNDDTYKEFSPRLGVNYRFNDDVMVYAGYSEGFKSGGFDMRANAAVNPDAINGYDPETVNAFELGMKGEFFDHRLRLNVALFYSEYEDIQTVNPQTADLITNGTGAPVPDGQVDTSANAVQNIGQATLQGIEFESLAQLSEHWSMSFNFGYIDTEIDEFLISDPNVLNAFIDVADDREIQNTPDWTGNLSLAYDQEFGDSGRLHANVGVSYRGAKQVFETPSVLDFGGYSLWDASVTWTSSDDRWNVGLHGKNLGDKEPRVSGYVFPGLGDNGNTATAFYGDPRTIALTGQYNF